MNKIKILEIVATVVGILTLIPEYRRVFVEKDISGYTTRTVIISMVSLALWVLHSFLSNSWMTMVALLLTLLLNIYVLYSILTNKETEQGKVSREGLVSLFGGTA